MHSITTQRLLLRPFSAPDKQLYFNLYMNPEVMRLICPPFNKQQAQEGYQRTLKQIDLKGNKRLSWVIVDKNIEQDLGIIGLSWDQESDDIINTGVILKRFGKGYGTESLGALAEYSFSHLNVKRITAQLASRNLPSENMLKKLGFHFIESDNAEIKSCYLEPAEQAGNYIQKVLINA
ncbi:GNAT family N-acetyltransferase [Thalassomonas haliotis]|uniref:GNAT family N-acetyltransferase n=1 Tax=Thalassomonas haliotis TaxID=485448 RepID=A0ABY7VJD7_9GAMM|nr:GNAT family N-acetyltransferase [Thalassomonas haliotis]WDE13859.1 GNAT family N-acetyltransferase [Thalassomonas haliotis]